MNFADYCTNELEFGYARTAKNIKRKFTHRLKKNVNVYKQRL